MALRLKIPSQFVVRKTFYCQETSKKLTDWGSPSDGLGPSFDTGGRLSSLFETCSVLLF